MTEVIETLPVNVTEHDIANCYWRSQNPVERALARIWNRRHPWPPLDCVGVSTDREAYIHFVPPRKSILLWLDKPLRHWMQRYRDGHQMQPIKGVVRNMGVVEDEI